MTTSAAKVSVDDMLGMRTAVGPWLGFWVLVTAWSCSSSDRNFGDGTGAVNAGDGNVAGAGIGDGGAPDTGGSASKPDGGVGILPSEGGGGAADIADGGLSVVSATPANQAVAVDRAGIVEVRFSAAVDKATVTADSFQVTGPLGPVAGQLSVAGEKVTFTPSKPLALLADYTVTLSSAIHSTTDAALRKYELAFQTRDGVFRKPERLTTTPAYLNEPQGSRSGYVVVSWVDKLTPASAFAALFEPATGTWGAATPLEADTQNDYAGATSAINEAGAALALAGGATAGAWKRASAGAWGPYKSAGLTQFRSVQLAEDGTAMTMWEATVTSEWRVFAAALSSDDKWSTTTTLGTKARTWSLQHFGSGYLALFSHEPDNRVFYRLSDASGVWAAEKPVTPLATGANYISLDAQGSAALFTWNDPKGRMQASIFDGTAWTAEDLGPVTGGTSASVGAKGHLATWLNQLSAYAASYDLKAGWGDPIKLGPTNAEDFGPAAEIDDSGNSLAAWPEAGSVTWRRLPHSATTWSEPAQLKDQDPYFLYSTSDASGNVMLIWTNPLGVWASRFE